jgi:hypothetical protein
MEANRKGKRQKLSDRNKGFYEEQKNYNQGWIEMAWAHEMTRHGAWCGSGWSDSKAQDSVAGYSTAHDALDQTCKEHDLAYWEKQELKAADEAFAKANVGKGLKRTIYGLGVGVQGKMRGTKRTRTGSGIFGIRDGTFTELPAVITPQKLGPKFGQSPAGKNPASNVSDGLARAISPTTAAPSLRQLAQRAQMNDGDEVPVSKVPRNISKIHPNHYTIRLPYIQRLEVQGSSCGYTNSRPLALIRLNSIYDPIMRYHGGITYSTSTGVGASVEINQEGYHNYDKAPQGRDIWAAHFKYYRVLRSDVKITFLNKFCAQASTDKLLSTTSAFQNAFAVGYELIDEDSLTTNNCNMFLMTKNAVRDVMAPADVAHVLNSGTLSTDYIPACPNTHTMTHTYMPETWQYHVEQSTQDTKWTAVGANPSLDHLMAIRAFHMNESNPVPDPETNYWFAVLVQIEYEVQFKECLDNFYKVENQATVTYTAPAVDGSAYTAA